MLVWTPGLTGSVMVKGGLLRHQNHLEDEGWGLEYEYF